MTSRTDTSLPDNLMTLQASDGAQIRVSLFGGHLCSWRSADGVEQLFMSQRSRWDDATPLRGGVPLIFPQFSDQGPMKKHGFARVLPWALLSAAQDDTGAGVMRLGLQDSAATTELAGKFSLELHLRFSAQSLSVQLQVENSGMTPFDFSAALHTYLRTDIPTATVAGLQQRPYLDTTNQRRAMTDPQPGLAITQEIDRIYMQVNKPVTLTSARGQLTLTQNGFAELVVWNPWIDKAATLPDLAPQEYLQFVCLEAAQVTQPVTLAPGQRWCGQQQLQAMSR